MIRLVAIVVLGWGLVSCQSDLFPPGRSPDPTTSPDSSTTPGQPKPTIEIPPPL